ncbi:DUF6299 family protein [Streptomyces sp. NPDC019937]|uniref:DUF6299 family protein n=1 Tax=Streptomyces sp. NPDC019937 TaxID=3154787 RepID=UPI0033FD3647
MRNRRRFLGAVTGLLIAVPLTPAAHAAPSPAVPSAGAAGLPGMPQTAQRSLPLPWGDNVTVDRVGYVGSTGTVALAGSYRCLGDGVSIPRADILVTLTQGQERRGIGGGSALCDGLTHRWSVEEPSAGRFVPGPAYVESSLLRLEVHQQLVPLPRTAAVGERAITLEAREM